jgi:hypothetical protein
MSTHPTSHVPDTAPADWPPSDHNSDPDGVQQGPIGRIVAASLVVGLLGAVALTLVAFGGTPEPVITGSALPPRWPSPVPGCSFSPPATTR